MGNRLLKFMGNGNAFAETNSSAYIIDKTNKSLYMIDIPDSCFTKYVNLIETLDIQNIFIMITHTHPDHISGLGRLCHYQKYIRNKDNIKVLCHSDLENTITSIALNMGFIDLVDIQSSDKTIDLPIDTDRIKITFYETFHVDGMSAYSIILYLYDPEKKLHSKIFYSGDSSFLNPETEYSIEKIAENFKNMLFEFDEIYIDLTFYESSVHNTSKNLLEIVDIIKDRRLLNRVQFYHFHSDSQYKSNLNHIAKEDMDKLEKSYWIVPVKIEEI